MKKLIIVLFVIQFFSCLSPISEMELDQSMQRIINDKKIAGFGVSVFNTEKIFFAKGYGFENMENKKPYTADSRQIVASVSKTIIGIALIKCEEMGLIKMDDPINNHLPFIIKNPYFPNEAITIKQLATHTSSIKYSELISGNYAFSKKKLPLKNFIKNHLTENGEWYKKENFKNMQPGSFYEYSNIAAALAAYIVEYKSGMPFNDFTQKYIFQEMGLKNTNWYDGENDLENTSELYELNPPNIFNKIKKQEIGIYPVRDLTTNVYELTKIGQAVLNNGKINDQQITTEKGTLKMISPQLENKMDGAETINHGLFWMIDKNQLGVPKKMIGHTGGDDGIFTMFWFDPKTKMGYIFLSNTGSREENIGAMIFLWRSLFRYGKGRKS